MSKIAAAPEIFSTFFYSVVTAILAMAFATRYFESYAPMAACAFIAFGLGEALRDLLEFNRKAIWEDSLPAWAVNRKLIIELLSMFCGVFIVASGYFALFSVTGMGSTKEAFRNQFSELLVHNFQVLIIGALLTFLYRAHGLVLVLSWNALNWAQSFISYALAAKLSSGDLSSAILLFSGLLPHLILEVIAYVTAGLAALFLSKAVAKYKVGSPEFMQVGKASVFMLLLSMALLIAAGLTEVTLGQSVFHRFV